MAIVCDYYIGATRIIVRDDKFCKPEEIEGILNEIGRKASIALQAAAREQKDETA